MKSKSLSIIFCLFIFLLPTFAQTNEAKMVDEFRELSCDDIIARLQNLAIQLNDAPKSIAYIILYEGKHRDFYADKEKYILPRFGESVARTRTMQRRLGFLKYNPKNFVFIDGGFRENYTVEFWIIPDGTNSPKPTPTLEVMKYRKGTPTDICREF